MRLRALSDELAAAGLRAAAYLAVVALLALFVAELLRSEPVGAAIAPLPDAEWQAIERPYPAFALAMPELAAADIGYTIRRHSLGGRQDILSWTETGPVGRALTVAVYRPGGEREQFGPDRDEIALLAQGHGASGPPVRAGSIDSKFGPAALFDIAVKTAHGPGRCLGLIRRFEEPRLQISGFSCHAAPVVVERKLLACALDRLTVIAAASDPKLAALFAAAEVKRSFCGEKGPLMASTRKRANWIAAKRNPRLRGRIAGR